MEIEVEGFNTKVITENFNKVVCEKLAEEIDPSLPGKTMIFCATDSHADMVVHLLKKAFEKQYGSVEDNAVMKITGAADKPMEKLRHYKNERLPKVAVTVDLLTTGINVPEITTLVFIRRVKSRILYEQMLGRATRLCPEIGKTTFRIFDPVDLYKDMQRWSDMKPVVPRPKVTFKKLLDELRDATAKEGQKLITDQLAAKMRTKVQHFDQPHNAKRKADFQTLFGMAPTKLAGIFKAGDTREILDLFGAHPTLSKFLDDTKGEAPKVLISGHKDAFVKMERGYGDAEKPEDYLAGFRDFIETNKNAIDALIVVTQRPRDLTRQQLRELKLTLDEAGYTETAIRAAYRDTTNQDIAASIIGFIRQQALGSALVPYEQRVDQALQKVLASQSWSTPQRKWLERIGSQMKAETVVDRDALDSGQFKAHGGFNRLNKVFGGKLEQVLGDLQEELWKEAG